MRAVATRFTLAAITRDLREYAADVPAEYDVPAAAERVNTALNEVLPPGWLLTTAGHLHYPDGEDSLITHVLEGLEHVYEGDDESPTLDFLAILEGTRP